MQIKKIEVKAVSVKTHKSAANGGAPYMWNDKKAGKQMPRTMVSLKDDTDTWYTGWSYKAGSRQESIKAGDVVEVVITEDNTVGRDGLPTTFKNWRFPKPEDVTAVENESLKARLAALEGLQASPNNLGVGNPSAQTAPEF